VSASQPGHLDVIGNTFDMPAGNTAFVLAVPAEDPCVVRVRTASGALVAISRLRKGEKVLATITRTGKTGPAAVTAVLLHYDKDLLDLEISVDGRIAVIGRPAATCSGTLHREGG